MRKTVHIHILASIVVCASALLSACRPSTDSMRINPAAGDTLTHHAVLLGMYAMSDGSVLVRVANPWSEGDYFGSYLLVHRDSIVPDNLPQDLKVVRVPVSRALVFSTVHGGALAELNALDAVVGVADAQYIAPGDTLRALLDSGRLADIGPAASPDPERVLALEPDVAMVSPMQDSDPAVALGGVPMVTLYCADYLEETPLGRAEWIRLLGALTGRGAQADSIFASVEKEDTDLAANVVRSRDARPKVLTDTEYSGVWYQPRRDSYASILLRDAGAVTATSDIPGTGSVPMDVAQVLDRNQDTQYWLIRSYGQLPSPSDLEAANPLYAHIPALRTGLYVCDTSVSPLFADQAFHPERVLREYVGIFHPGLLPDYELKYFIRR